MRLNFRTWLAYLALLLACLGIVSSAGAASLVTEDYILSASNGLTDENFGIWVDVDGTRAIVGARYADDPLNPGNQIGAAYIYDYTGGSWVQSAQLVPTLGDWGGRIGESVAIRGDTAVIGAAYQSYGTAGTEAGAAWVYQYEGGNWVEKKMLTASDGAAADHFGGVAIDGDNIVVTAGLADIGGLSNVGAAYVYGRNQGGANNWGEVQKLTMTEPIANSKINYVAVDGNTIVAGAYTGSSAYVFQYDGTWSQTAKLTGAGGRFGRSVDVQGDTIAVGAYYNNEGYVFDRNEGGAGAWGQVAHLTPSRGGNVGQGAAIIDANTVAFSGNTVDLPPGLDSEGAAFIFRKDVGTGQWGETNMVVASTPTSGDSLGQCIAASGSTLLAGARNGDGQQVDSGTAYVYTVPPSGDPIVLPDPPAPGPGPGGPVVPSGTTPYAWYRTDLEGAIVTSDDPYYPGNPQTLYLADQTTNGRYLTVSTGNPEVTSNAPSGETTLTLDGNDFMVCVPEDFGNTAPGTIFAVWRGTDYATGHQNGVTYVYDGYGNSPPIRQFLSYAAKMDTDPDHPYISAGSGKDGDGYYHLADVQQETVLNRWIISSVSCVDGTEDFIRVWYEDEDAAAQIFTGDLAAGCGMNGLVLGADRRLTYGLPGDIAELIIFEGELAPTEVAAIEQALYDRWFASVIIPGDTDNDKDVDEDDLATLAGNWGASVTPGDVTAGDFDNDGIVGPNDAAILAANWGYGTSETTTVPEPSLPAMLLVGVLVWAIRRRAR